jgi:AraC-like DNA-binding protein/mannose/fructose/N-acetylgalactosamine-specific phosphotransferase system component IIC
MLEYLNIDFQVLLDGIGLVQGVTIAILLMALSIRKYRSTFFLGFFLLFYSLELATWISVNTQISRNYPEFFLLPFNFSWILFPLFNLYTQQVSVYSNRKIKYWLLIPGIISILAQCIIYFLPYETKVVIEDSYWHILTFWILGNYFSWGVGLWNLRLLYRHRIEVLNTYSFVDSKELRWARFFLIYLLATSVFGHIIAYVYPLGFEDNTIFSIMDLIAIYWVSYFGITQRNVRSLISNEWTPKGSKDEGKPRSYSPDVIPGRLEDLMVQIHKHMDEHESFINPELTIMDLADGINEHPKLVSEAINTVGKQNFNSYINEHRIRKAEELLKTDKGTHLSVEGIGIEVGFKSKSAFYSAFKKFTGTTPTQYRDNRAA